MQQNLTYAGLSSAIDDSSDSDWREDVDDADDADDGRNKMGTDPWAQESVMGVTGSKRVFKTCIIQYKMQNIDTVQDTQS